MKDKFANGNMRRDHRTKRTVSHNFVNLPTSVASDNGDMISYTYTATGIKLSQALRAGKGGSSTRRDYAGPFVFVNNAPAWVSTPHGRFVQVNGSWENEFHLHDHLGNTRVVLMEEDTGTLATLQQNHYYPFGMLNPSLSIGNTLGALKDNRYLYNGKELQDDFGLDWYDYGARFYDAQIGRWHVVDPLAEEYCSISTYAYVANNPIRYLDPDGRVVRDPNGNIVFTSTNKNTIYTQYYNTNQQTGVRTVVYFRATEGKILTDKGNEVTVYRANSPDVYIAEIDVNGNVLSNNVINQQFENRYNCTGNALTDQAFTISSDQITAQYLQDEGFVTLGAGQQTQAGDVGIYIDNASGIITHLEPFLTNNTVSTKGGIAVDQGPIAPGQNQLFSQEATYCVIRKIQPDRIVNIPIGATSNVKQGVNQVDNNTFNTIRQNLNP